MRTFGDLIHKYILKNRPTSNKEIQQILSSIGLDNADIYLRDGPFSSDVGNLKLHPFRDTHWVLHINKNYFDVYGC